MKIPLSTMPPLKRTTPALASHEQIVLREQAGYRSHSGAGWKTVDCLLTNKRLILSQLRKVLVEIPLDTICDLKTEKHYYVLRKREAIGVYFCQGEGAPRKVVWIIVNAAFFWRVRLYQMTLLRVDEGLIRRLSEKLDDSCAAILWHLWVHRHAKIIELAEVCGADDHMDVLTHIKDAINPVALKEIGCPLLFFDRKRAVPDTGEIILFSWWLAGNPKPVMEEQTERLLDIFDEGDFFQVILEVKRVERSDLHISMDGRELVVASRQPTSPWVERFLLPDKVVFHTHRVSLNHSLLEIRLEKEGEYEKIQ